MLGSILNQFVAAAQGSVDVDRKFWRHICHNYAEGSTFLSGSISVFAVFKGDGSWQGWERLMRMTNIYVMNAQGVPTKLENEVSRYPVIKLDKVAPGYVTVDVQVNDNGTEYDALLFAATCRLMSYRAIRCAAVDVGLGLERRYGAWKLSRRPYGCVPT
ncbi:Aste57867_23571 [Aphanomyces stellatus]|uniref:Aste57867_23571 protein n=1 Tax=Aphanomyces stellatus TaxID=120398 RepID=A0A485LPQ2_9STRA|nr:hypothetical protein As57867_023500 [Aphanomyces stellatus]VFU00216.1 Aste57867_23571 [Aphanomyces stellatus]